MAQRSIFHLAYHVKDLDESRKFYGEILGCKEGRSTDTWVDFEFFGHQISLHLGKPFETTRTGMLANLFCVLSKFEIKNSNFLGVVGEHMVLMPHLGIILPLDDWLSLAKRLESHGTKFDIPPVIRFEGQPGEQRTMFFFDPSGNPIEVKGFKDFDGIFAHQ